MNNLTKNIIGRIGAAGLSDHAPTFNLIADVLHWVLAEEDKTDPGFVPSGIISESMSDLRRPGQFGSCGLAIAAPKMRDAIRFALAMEDLWIETQEDKEKARQLQTLFALLTESISSISTER